MKARGAVDVAVEKLGVGAAAATVIDLSAW